MSMKEFMEKHNVFWQYPVITEKTFYLQNKDNVNYFGFPWATMIDRNASINFDVFVDGNAQRYTCCQHIYYRKIIGVLKKLNIKTLYASHKKIGEETIDGITIKPCPLYAVNVEDNERNMLFKDVDFLGCERKYLYSFVGGYNNNYMNKTRPKIFEMKHPENCFIENSNGWHFEKVVYGQQKKDGTYRKDEKGIEKYNQILLDSRYTLCPCGSGPNSIRFWESLAIGSIPVLLSDTLDLPSHELFNNSIVRLKESELENLGNILEKISVEEEKVRRENCIKIYNYFKDNYGQEVPQKYNEIVHYCCASYFHGCFGGVARFDFQLWKVFPNRKFFQGPGQKGAMINYLKKCKNPIVFTDNQLACDVPNEYDLYLVHHGCAKTTLSRNPDWGEPWRSLCTKGQDKMLNHRKPENTTIISISAACTDDFTKYFGEKYTKFKRLDILHPSELDESRFKTKFNSKPVILGNWNHVKKGQRLIPKLKNSMKNFEFRQLSVGPGSSKNNNFNDFNRRKEDAYLKCDIFLQISNSEGNSYATLDAMICGLAIVASNVGLFYKDVPENCFVKMEWEKNGDVDYVKSKIEEAWSRREELSKNCRKWYLENCSFRDWSNTMKGLV